MLSVILLAAWLYMALGVVWLTYLGFNGRFVIQAPADAPRYMIALAFFVVLMRIALTWPVMLVDYVRWRMRQ